MCVCARARVLAIFLSFRFVVLCILSNVNVNYYIKRPFSEFNTLPTVVELCLWYGAVETGPDLYVVVVFYLCFMYLDYICLLFLESVYCAVSVIRQMAVY